VEIAREMRTSMTELNQRWKKDGKARFWKNQGIDKISIRAGIHTGNVVTGNIGSQTK